MKDNEIHRHIEDLVREEHELLERGEAGSLRADEHARVEEVQVQLDRYWDLLRQRRARRDAGQDPDATHLRSEKVIEHYEQ